MSCELTRRGGDRGSLAPRERDLKREQQQERRGETTEGHRREVGSDNIVGVCGEGASWFEARK